MGRTQEALRARLAWPQGQGTMVPFDFFGEKMILLTSLFVVRETALTAELEKNPG